MKPLLFTNGRENEWVCVFPQSCDHEVAGKKIKIPHPFTYMCGYFCGSKMN